MNTHTCGRCNRPLKTEKSMVAGYGPWCLKKMKEQEEAPPEGQTTIDDYIETGESVIAVEEFIKKRGYTYKVKDIVEYYLEYWKKGHYVSYTMRDCIENLKDELEDIIEGENK